MLQMISFAYQKIIHRIHKNNLENCVDKKYYTHNTTWVL